MVPLPASPMLSRRGELPAGPGWAFEVKWDGFRTLVSTEEGLPGTQPARLEYDATAARTPKPLPSGVVLDC